jgi:hypothetical protein
VDAVTPLDVVTSEGVRFHITDSEGDDWVNGVTSIRVTHPDGVGVLWKLPTRLLLRLDVCNAVNEEIVLELQERVEAIGRWTR